MGKYIDPEIGIRLAEIRRRRGLTQRQLATAIGVTLTSLQNYERGRNAVTDSRLDAPCGPGGGVAGCSLARCAASRSTC